MWDGNDDDGEERTSPAAREGLQLLRSFVDSFITETFLPEVHVDFRCTTKG